MARVKDLTEVTVTDLWREVKEQFWEDVNTETLRMVRRFLESALEEELVSHLQASWYQRNPDRQGYRNGYRRRDLWTRFGLLEKLRLPRDRDGGFQPKVLERYQRRQEEVNVTIRELFLRGISTRKVGEVVRPLLGAGVSAQTVSRICYSLDGEVARYHRRLLVDAYIYLLLDGVTLKVKSPTGVRKRLLLCAYGITAGGTRELLSFRQASAESEAQWEAFLRDLYERGLAGRSLRLITIDGCSGLRGALELVYPYVAVQRCWAHKLRNVAAKVPRRYQKECLAGAKEIYQASTQREAKVRFRQWANRWWAVAPKAVRCVEEDLEELLSFIACPSVHWRRIRTTNAIERAFREVRRRTRPMSCFQNKESVDRIVYGVISHLNQAWREKPIPQFTHNT
jgi:transposase-like protein